MLEIQKGGSKMETDLVIVGGGPAGLSAAITATSYGADVILIEESFSLGGQLRQQTQLHANLPSKFFAERGTSLVKRLTSQLETPNLKILRNHTMIGAYKNGHIGVTNGKTTFEIEAKKNIIASGAAENAWIFPGWTLPGVMTAGAAQILLNREFVYPGKQVMMIGSNSFALEVVKQLYECGISVQAIVEASETILSRDQALLSMCKKNNIPFFLNSTIESVSGSGHVEKMTIRTSEGMMEELEVDLICTANGFSPILEAFQIMSCDLTHSEVLGGWLPTYSVNFQTSNPSVYLAGNAAGITSLGSILLTGEIAALSALESLQFISERDSNRKKAALWEELYQIETFFNKDTMLARLELVKHYHSERGLPLPDFVDPLKGEMLFG